MLRPDESTLLNHSALLPQARTTLQTALGNRAVIVANGQQAGTTGAGSTQGGNSAFLDGLVYANTTIPAGNTVANTTTATILTSSYSVPANSLSVGDVIVVKAWGLYGTNIVAPTFLGELLYQSTVIASTGVITTIAGVTNGGWWAEVQSHVTSLGVTGTFESQGYAEFATAATTGLSVNMTNTAPVTVATTLASILRLRVTWGTANAANTITMRNLSIRIEQAQNFG